MKKFLALLLCVQLVLCAGVGLAQAAPAAQQADVVIVGGMHACNTQVMQKWGYDETMVDMFRRQSAAASAWVSPPYTVCISTLPPGMWIG